MFLSNFLAVNESSNIGESPSSILSSSPPAQQEFEEEKYLGLYHRALSLYGSEEYERSEKIFNELITSDYIRKFGKNGSEKNTDIGTKLQFQSYKYLGFISEKRQDFTSCLHFLEKAIQVNDSDVNVLFKIGLTSVKNNDYRKARSACERSLQIHRAYHHWPSLELLIMITFKIKDHFACLDYIALALSRNPHYSRGKELRDAIIYENENLAIDLGLKASRPQPPNFKVSSQWISPPARDPKPRNPCILVSQNSLTHLLFLLHSEYESLSTDKYNDSLFLLAREKPSLLSVSVQNLVREMVDIVVNNEKKESRECVSGILNEIFLSIPPDSNRYFIEDILLEILSEVVLLSNDFFTDFTAIRRSSRAKVPEHHLLDNNLNGSHGTESVKAHLESLIPLSLLHSRENDDEEESEKEKMTDDEYEYDGSVIKNKKTSSNSKSSETTTTRVEYPPLTPESEAEIIESLLSKVLISNGGILDVFQKLLNFISSLQVSWTNELTDAYWTSYLIWRRHFLLTDPPLGHRVLSSEYSIILTANEIFKDRNLRGLQNTSKEFLFEDYNYLEMNLSGLCVSLQIRVIFLLFSHSLETQNTEKASLYFRRLKDLPSESNIPLPYSHYYILPEKDISESYESLIRRFLVKDLEVLYEEKKYGVIISLLPYSCLSSDSAERVYQLSLLIDSHWKERNYGLCLKVTSKALIELIDFHFNRCESTLWTIDLVDYFKTWECCLSFVSVNTLSLSLRSRLLQNLLKVCLLQIEFFSRGSVVKSVLPWILVYRILESEKDSSAFLIAAHNYLGPLSLCTEDDGQLLLLLLENGGTDNKKALEQAIYCLFGHPSKKSRVKHLTDHGVSQIPLNLSKCLTLYGILKPESLPEFDDFKSNSISSDTEVVFKRILSCFPDDISERAIQMMNLVTQSSPNFESLDSTKTLHPTLIDFYYYLADYYFKNRDFKPAINYYLMDLSYNPKRVDSWIALSLALANRVEETFSNLTIEMNYKSVLSEASNVIQVFNNCTIHNPKGATIYIEFASFTYILHAFTSRTLNSVPETLNLKMFKSLEALKATSIKIAHHNYELALSIQSKEECLGCGVDERWLLFYMMGKIKEKNIATLLEALSDYGSAFDNLLFQGATLPKKIHYNAPQEHSLALLEVYFRIHATILKKVEFLEKDPLKGDFSRRLLASVNEKMERILDKGLIEKGIPHSSNSLSSSCVSALETVLSVFPQHFKSLIVLSSHFIQGKCEKKALGYLLGNCESKASLFGERKSNNLWNGIWRLPLPELDRPGSFPLHISKATSLLLDVLLSTNDYVLLSEVTGILKKPPPDGERTYLVERDRLNFVKQSQTYLMKAIGNAFKGVDNSAPMDCIQLLLNIYLLYTKSKKSFRDDSIKNALLHFANQTLGFSCTSYEEVSHLCQRILADKNEGVRVENPSLLSSSSPYNANTNSNTTTITSNTTNPHFKVGVSKGLLRKNHFMTQRVSKSPGTIIKSSSEARSKLKTFKKSLQNVLKSNGTLISKSVVAAANHRSSSLTLSKAQPESTLSSPSVDSEIIYID